MSNELQSIIETTTKIDIKQYERYIDKQIKTRTRSTKEKRFMRNLMKFDVIEKKILRIKSCYFCESKKHLKRNCFKKTIEITKKWIKIIEKVNETNRKSITNENHNLQHYNACYEDNCYVHLSNKQKLKYYFKKFKQTQIKSKKSIIKLSLYATKKSLIVALKMTIENHETIVLINNESINRMTTKLM